MKNVTVTDSSGTAAVMSEAHNYPFGMNINALSYTNPLQKIANKFLYNSKELQDDLGLGWYDYGNRFYDPQVPHFTTIDPMIEEHYNYTGYAYVYNNPIKLIDPLGLDTVWVFDQKEKPTSRKGYTGTMYVEIYGEVNGPYDVSSYPTNANSTTIVNEGEYNYNNKYGHHSSERKGLNLVNDKGERKTPGTKPNGEKRDMLYINVHDSFNDKKSRGSEGCITIPTGDPQNFFENFDWSGANNNLGQKVGKVGTIGNSTGIIIIKRQGKDKVGVHLNSKLAEKNNSKFNPFKKTYEFNIFPSN
jgi:RHS repeat-associated protein